MYKKIYSFIFLSLLTLSFVCFSSHKEKDQSPDENNKNYRALVLEAAYALENNQVSQGMKQLKDIFPNELQEIIIEYAKGYPNFVFYAKVQGHQRVVSCLCVLLDGKLCSGSGSLLNGTIRIWDSSKFSSTSLENKDACVAILKSHGNSVISYEVTSLCTLPDNRLCSGSADNTIYIWDPSKFSSTSPDNKDACIAILESHKDAIWSLCALKDGLVCSGSADKTVRIWNPSKFSSTSPDNKDTCVATLKGHENTVTSLCTLADNRLCSGSADNTIRIWDPSKFSSTSPDNKEACVATLKDSASVHSLCTLPDGRLCSGSADKTIRVWDPSKFSSTSPDNKDSCVAILKDLNDSVMSLCTMPNGILAVGLANGEIAFYKTVQSDLELVWDMYQNPYKYSHYTCPLPTQLTQYRLSNSISAQIARSVRALKLPPIAHGLIRYNLLPKNKNTTSKRVDQKDKKEKQDQ